MIDDSNYITPHEAALAVVATSMKKSRLQLDTLVVNSVVGGMLFSCGALMSIAFRSDNPGLLENNPGILRAMSGVTFGIALYLVIITGSDLFNSNILYFSVGILRRAVSIYDLLISWFVSLLGNIAGSLFVSYIFGYLSGIGKQELWRKTSRLILEENASFSFIETFLKAIAGNFLVCLGVYLQLLAKPIHVKLIVLLLPIFFFITIGFTHVVGDMTLCFIGMYNGGNVSPGEYIWKLLIPATIGNMIGGAAFSLLVPFYLHLIVVERDIKKLDLPEYDNRDEQPELNVDSRVVRVIPPKEANIDSMMDLDDAENMNYPENTESQSTQTSNQSSYSYHGKPFNYSGPQGYSTSISAHNAYLPSLTRVKTGMTCRSAISGASRISGDESQVRSPPGVFPVYGMAEPLEREKYIQNSTFSAKEIKFEEGIQEHKKGMNLRESETPASINTLGNDLFQKKFIERNSSYNVLKQKPGARLQEIISKATNLGILESNIQTAKQDLEDSPASIQDTSYPNQYINREIDPTRDVSLGLANSSNNSQVDTNIDVSEKKHLSVGNSSRKTSAIKNSKSENTNSESGSTISPSSITTQKSKRSVSAKKSNT